MRKRRHHQTFTRHAAGRQAPLQYLGHLARPLIGQLRGGGQACGAWRVGPRMGCHQHAPALAGERLRHTFEQRRSGALRGGKALGDDGSEPTLIAIDLPAGIDAATRELE